MSPTLRLPEQFDPAQFFPKPDDLDQSLKRESENHMKDDGVYSSPWPVGAAVLAPIFALQRLLPKCLAIREIGFAIAIGLATRSILALSSSS